MPFQMGNTHGKNGRPKGARNKLTEQTEKLFAAATSGPSAKRSLEKLRSENPAAFWNAVTRLLPKTVDITAEVTVSKIESTIVDPKNQGR